MPTGRFASRLEVARLARHLEAPSKTTKVTVQYGVLVEQTESDEADLLTVSPNSERTARSFADGYPNRTVITRTVAVTTITTPWEKP